MYCLLGTLAAISLLQSSCCCNRGCTTNRCCNRGCTTNRCCNNRCRW